MGFPIARRLLERGEPVVFHARRAKVAAALTSLGARGAESLEGMAETCDVVIVCVYDDQQVRDVCLGRNGLLGLLSPGSVLINHTTCDPNTVRSMAELAEVCGVSVLDAALSGSPVDISEGHLTLWVGGRADLLESVRPILRTYGDPVIHVGDVGDGQWVKLVNNALFAANVALVSQAARTLSQVGVTPVRGLGAIEHGSGDSQALRMVVRFGGAEALGRVAGPFIRKDLETVMRAAVEGRVELGILAEVAESMGEQA